MNCGLEFLLISVSAETLLDPHDLRLDVLAVQDLKWGENVTIDQGPSHVSAPLRVGQGGVDGKSVRVPVSLLRIRRRMSV